MRHPIVLAFSLALLTACGDGTGADFPGRFDSSGGLVNTNAPDPAADPDEPAAPLVEAEGGADGIGIVGGRAFPPRRAFPSEYDNARSAADVTNDRSGLTDGDRASDTGTLDGQDTTGGGQNSGEATYQGIYTADVYTNIDNPLQIEVERATSDLVLSINLTTGRISGRSADNRLEVGRAARSIRDNRYEGAVRLDGVTGIFDGVLTSDTANADFAGDDATTAYIGRFETQRAAAP